MSDDDLTWQHLSSRYEEAGLMLFEKRIDTLRNPRNGQTFDRLVLESVDWVNVCLLYTSPSPRDLSTSRMPSSA